MTTLDGKGQQRYGTTAEWASADPVLLAGEIGWDTDLKQGKLGDGTTAWSVLTFMFDQLGAAAAAQAAAEATAAAALTAHGIDTTSVHGIADTSVLLTTSAIGSTVAAQVHTHVGTETRAISVPGTLAVATGIIEWPITRTETLTKITARLGDGQSPVGADVKVNVKLNGTSVSSPLSNQITISPGSVLDTITPDTTAMVDGDYLSIDIDQVGATSTEGANLIVVIESTFTI